MQEQLSAQLNKYKKITDSITTFISEQVKNAGADGVIFGLSGGIDSAVVAALCKKAIGNHCQALLMPYEGITPNEETDDGALVAETFDITYTIRPIQFITNLFTVGDKPDRLTKGNLMARVRANMLYYEAQKRRYLVVGTDDRSEYLIGYFTKYGDGASDMLPIASLYKHQVRELGAYLGVPDHIVLKKSNPHLWIGQSASHELGVDYDTIDKILMALFDEGLSIEKASKKLIVPPATVNRVRAFYKKSEHKRNLPPIAKI